mgnify:CR=1 FL=1
MLLPAHSPTLAENGSDTPEYRQIYLRRMIEWREETKEQAFMSYRQSLEFDRVPKYIEYLQGNQWDARRARYKSKYVENKLELMRRQKLALLSDSRPVPDVSSNIDAYQDAAKAIEGCLVAEWYRDNQQEVLVNAIDIAMLHGISFIREGASSPGKSRSIALGPDCVLPIQPSYQSIQDATAVLYRTWKPVNYFKKVFPMASAGIEEQAKFNDSKATERYIRPLNIPESTWSQMSPGFKRIVGGKELPDGGLHVTSRNYGAIELEEYYVDDLSINESNRSIIIKDPYLPVGLHNWWYKVEPGERLYPRKRLIIFGGRRLMYDGPSPYWHGMYPFTELRLNPVPWSYYGFSSYRSLIEMQNAINEIPAGILDLTKKALNPVLIHKSTVASKAAIREFVRDQPGATLQVNPSVNIEQDINFSKPPELPAYITQFYAQGLLPEFDKMTGIQDVAAMTEKQQMPSGDTLNQMQDALQTPLRREERYIESFIQKIGQQKVSNIIQFYTAKQRMRILGGDGLTWQDFEFDPGKIHPADESPTGLDKQTKESYWTQFSLQIQPGSMHQGAHDKSKMMALQEVSRGLISRQEYLKATGRSEEQAQQILQEIAQEQMVAGEMARSMRTPRSAGAKDGPSAPTG